MGSYIFAQSQFFLKLFILVQVAYLKNFVIIDTNNLEISQNKLTIRKNIIRVAYIIPNNLNYLSVKVPLNQCNRFGV